MINFFPNFFILFFICLFALWLGKLKKSNLMACFQNMSGKLGSNTPLSSSSLTKCFSNLIVLNFYCFRPYLMDLGSTNGTFINVSLSLKLNLTDPVDLCAHKFGIFECKTDHLWSHFSFIFPSTFAFTFCLGAFRIFALNLRDIMNSLRRTLLNLVTVGMPYARIIFYCCILSFYSFCNPGLGI